MHSVSEFLDEYWHIQIISSEESLLLLWIFPLLKNCFYYAVAESDFGLNSRDAKN